MGVVIEAFRCCPAASRSGRIRQVEHNGQCVLPPTLPPEVLSELTLESFVAVPASGQPAWGLRGSTGEQCGQVERGDVPLAGEGEVLACEGVLAIAQYGAQQADGLGEVVRVC